MTNEDAATLIDAMVDDSDTLAHVAACLAIALRARGVCPACVDELLATVRAQAAGPATPATDIAMASIRRAAEERAERRRMAS